MQTRLNHIQFFVRPDNMPFYRDLFAFLGWQTLMDDIAFADVRMLGVASGNGESLWFIGQVPKDVTNDYDGPGANHIAIGTTAQADVDAAAAFLTERGVAMLFETPRHRPEFSGGGQTYYQIMFESPDRILWEIVYTGAKTA